MLAVPTILPTDAPILEATRPPRERDDVRLLVSDGDTVASTHFRHLADYLRPGDLLVVNDSATFPAAISVDGVLIHFSTCLSGYTHWWRSGTTRWVVEPRPFREGELCFPDGGRLRLLSPYQGSARLWEAELTVPGPLVQWLSLWGRPIRYDYVPQQYCFDEYQTMFARRPGSAEMPSAGRPFTLRTVNALQQRGIGFASLTLHTGVASQELHEAPYAEYFEVSSETASQVQRTREAGGRVVAVGTTVVRALESAPNGGSGWTERIISAEGGVHTLDGLLTGMHEPRATHLAMLAAFMDPTGLRRAYEQALREGYLWHEFGDMHLIM